jgi:hypothetical protein
LLEFYEKYSRQESRLDIDVSENGRLYGEDWYRFLSRCRAVLGVEAGVSIFDIEDKVRHACEGFSGTQPEASFSDIENRILKEWENNIFYRTISPRHFEAAAFRTCQILFEGKYSGILEPMVHYIPLRKDFSNIDFVMDTFLNNTERQRIQDNAYRDLIASGRFSYRRFVEAFESKALRAWFTF